MRKVVYYQRAVPPKKWLIWAALLWDHILIHPLLAETLRDQDDFRREVKADSDCSKLFEIVNKTNICEATWPQPLTDFLDGEKKEELKQYFDNAIRGLDYLIAEADKHIAKGTPGHKVSFEQMIDFYTKCIQLSLPKRFSQAFPNVDFFFAEESSFRRASNFITMSSSQR